MKQNPKLQQVQANMRSPGLAVYRFLGHDDRNLVDIISQDALEVSRLGLTNQAVASKLGSLTNQGLQKLGDPLIEGNLQVEVTEHKGFIPCPFGDNYRAPKRDTTVTCLDTNKSITWSQLNIHLIEEHGFFEGKGAPYRLNPQEVADVLHDQNEFTGNPLDLALQLELDGKKYYLHLAKQVSNEQIAELFLALADDEARHYRVIKEMLEKDIYTYIKRDSSRSIHVIFPDPKSADELVQELTNQIEVYRLAIDFEKKSKQLYLDLAEKATHSHQKEVFSRLAKDEEEHGTILWKLMELTRRPEQWYPYLDS